MILSVAHVQFAYNGLPVLKGLTFDVKAGQVIAVLGVNGAGKSTLLKCINRILKPAQGVILVGGHDVREMSRIEAARRFGYVPQHRDEEEMVVFDAVLLGRKPHIKWAATTRDMEVVERVIRETGLSALAMRPVNRLSGGGGTEGAHRAGPCAGAESPPSR
jgi:iron complex transport system ATP-binding protein